MKTFTVLFSADLHGNETQYKKLVSYASQMKVGAVVIGGDIAPKDGGHSYVAKQRAFFKDTLPTLLKPLAGKVKVYLMMGNDDCSINMDMLQAHEGKLFELLHYKRHKLHEDFDIVGYSCVSITPFGIKDWERYEFTSTPKEYEIEYTRRKKGVYRYTGRKSIKEGWKEFVFTPEIEQRESIQKDLLEGPFATKPQKTLYAIHCPPSNTNLDMIQSREHVGSMAIRNFIERMQPAMTLHGHIHETVDVSGNFIHKLGSTLCLSAGNHNVGEEIAVLRVDLYDLQNPQRMNL